MQYPLSTRGRHHGSAQNSTNNQTRIGSTDLLSAFATGHQWQQLDPIKPSSTPAHSPLPPMVFQAHAKV